MKTVATGVVIVADRVRRAAMVVSAGLAVLVAREEIARPANVVDLEVFAQKVVVARAAPVRKAPPMP